MKAPLCAMAAAALIAGCGQKPEPAAVPAHTNSSAANPATAPVDYLGALAKGQQQAVKTIDTASLDRAIQMFAVEKGRNPKDLNELVEEKFIPKLPQAPYGMKLAYDANTGTVKVVNQ